MAQDYYKTLGVEKNASQEDVKKAFRKLAHEHHPDKQTGNADKFKEINEAYQTLGNEQKRKQYDQFGSAYNNNAGGGFNSGNPYGQSGGFRQGNVNFDFGDMGDLGDLFSFFGGGQSRSAKVSRGEDMEIEIAIEFEESVFGVEKIIDLSKKVSCEYCGNTGAEPGSKIASCPTCNGTGQVHKIQQTILGNFQSTAVCSECHGTGKRPDKKCSKCRGTGSVYGTEKIKVKIPAGISSGQSIKLSGKGEQPDRPGGQAGDLYIHVRVRENKKFRRVGDDVFSESHISLTQAILGDSIGIETVDGEVKLKIHEGTQSHTQFRLRDKGVPHLNGRGRGDHLVDVIVDIPRSISRNTRKILEDLKI
ncbi:MAG: molecular chaperone DnaJ [bacterium]